MWISNYLNSLMVPQAKTLIRSPLKETDANLKQPRNLALGGQLGDLDTHGAPGEPSKKRVFNKLDHDVSQYQQQSQRQQQSSQSHIVIQQQQQQQLQHVQQVKKKPRVERTRSIEGAVLVDKDVALKRIAPKVTPKELLEWQTTWRKIMSRNSKIYFDVTDEPDVSKHARRTLDKKKELLRRAFLSLGAEVTPFFDNSCTIVVTRRSTDNIHLLSENDILRRAKKNYMKVWGYEKALRFLNNLDVDFAELMRTKSTSFAAPTLTNLLQNEKLYGPTDRDPKTRRDDTHYFRYPHVYMYDLWQIWSPIITLEWKPQELANKDNLPYPTLKMGTFGRCPFVGDRNCDESSYRRVVRRYNRDKANKKTAILLRRLYQRHAFPCLVPEEEILVIPHTCNDSKKSFLKWQETKGLGAAQQRDHGSNDERTQNVQHQQQESQIGGVQTLNEPHQHTPPEQLGINDPIPVDDSLTRTRIVTEDDIDTSKVSASLIAEQKPNSPGEAAPAPKFGPPRLPSLSRQETEDGCLADTNNIQRRQSKISHEIKASGVYQSIDVATSFGNGLGPTRASVMSKSIKTLNKLAVDRKLGTTGINKATHPNTHTKSGTHRAVTRLQTQLANEGRAQTTCQSVVQGESESVPKPASDLKFANMDKQQEASRQQPKTITTVVVEEKKVVRNSGYCENCRVKYSSLSDHVLSERHLSFAENDLNFEAIDSLIEKLKFGI